MVVSLIKNSILYICGFQIFSSLTEEKHTNISIHIFYTFISICLSIETLFLKAYIPSFSYFISALSFFLIISVARKNNVQSIFCFSLLSYGLNLVLYESFLLVFALCLSPLHLTQTEKSIDFVTIVFTIIYPLILFLIGKLNIVKSGFSCIKNRISIYAGCVIVLFSLLIISFEQITPDTFSHLRFLRMFAILAIAFALVIWWRSQITKSYREKLRMLEVESLRTSLDEKLLYIKQLEDENERMGRIIHKDNRIVNAMADSVTEYLSGISSLSSTELTAMGQAMSARIEDIRSHRQALLASPAIDKVKQVQTGCTGIDALIAFMNKDATKHRISLQVHFNKEFFVAGSLCMEEMDMVHLLSDLLANAIIATKNQDIRIIELSMQIIKGTPTIAISDSGIPFEIDTYMNYGLEKASTHLVEGGNGIGLLDIWALKEQYKATLYIDEAPASNNYTKQVAFLFDRKNRYIISSGRYKELQRRQNRADLFIIPPDNEAHH